ncbi:MAG: 50S ribosomal protein L11 methyltransferase [Anaerolineales bacterium]|nr:50S ribosomal protein L11 methyltransferase [Anaerolineales bacterium]
MKNHWLEVSLEVAGELAEAVADVLARFAPNGVVMEQSVRYANADDAGAPFGPVNVRAYLLIDEKIEETRQKLEESLWYLGRIQALPEPEFRLVADQNWMEAWKEHYHPIPIGRRLIIVPVWLESTDPGRIPIRIDPGMAFGTGTHPTTQLSLELIEEYYTAQQPTGDLGTVIDVGCGSGILSIAALKLGAQLALGVDIDMASVENSRQNAANNGIGGELKLGQGSVEEIKNGSFVFSQAPLVLANILAPILIRLLDAGLADLVLPGGTLMLSGILLEQEEKVRLAARIKGLDVSARKQLGDWSALVFIKS